MKYLQRILAKSPAALDSVHMFDACVCPNIRNKAKRHIPVLNFEIFMLYFG